MWNQFSRASILIGLQCVFICIIAWLNIQQLKQQAHTMEAKQKVAFENQLRLYNQRPNYAQYQLLLKDLPEIAYLSIHVNKRPFFIYGTTEQLEHGAKSVDGASVTEANELLSYSYHLSAIPLNKKVEETIFVSIILVVLTCFLLIMTHLFFRRRYVESISELIYSIKSLSQGNIVEPKLLARKGRLSEAAHALKEYLDQLQAQQKHEAELTERMRTSIIESSLDGLITINIDNKIIEFSPSAERIFGWKREEVLGQNLTELVIPEPMRAGHAKGMKHFAETGEGPLIGKRVEVEALRRDGSLFPVELGLIKTEHGGTRLCTASIRDISERVQNEKDLLMAKEQAEAASQAKSRFLSYMSHEIRSPLNAVLGSLNLLNEKAVTSEQKRLVHIAHSSGENLLTVINEILDFSKIEAGHIEISKDNIDISEMIHKLLVVADSKLKNNAIAFMGYIQPNVPKVIVSDSVKLRQLINIFVDNALKFTKKGVIGVEIGVRKRELEKTLQEKPELENTEQETEQEVGSGSELDSANQEMLDINIFDSGVGISEEMQASIFAEFKQVDAARDTGYGGTGLGLAIAKNFVEAMGGQIEVFSEVGKGSQFTLSLPIEVLDQAERYQSLNLPVDDAVVLFLSANQRLQQKFEQIYQDTATCLFAETLEQASTLVNQHSGAHMVLLVDTHTIQVDLAFDDLASRCQQTIVLHDSLVVDAAWVNKGWYFVESPLINLELNRVIQGETSSKVFENDANTPLKFSGHILLVEDVEANRIVAGEMLIGRGFEVDYAVDGVEAVNQANQRKYDVILMDVRMPKMNGIDASEHIRNEGGPNANTPIIALTANAEKSEISRCQKAGIDKFISKPFDTVNLLANIQDSIQNGQSQRDSAVSEEEAASLDAQPIINLDTINQLEKDTSTEAMPRMLQMFLDEMTKRVDALKEAKAIGDVGEIREQAHAIKSCSGTFGALRMHHLGKNLESMCVAEKVDLIQINQVVDALLNIAQQTEEAVVEQRSNYLS
jgi:two-component system, sensor histidine kinase and response regulator